MSTADSRLARPKTAIILCQVLELEIEHFAAGMDHVVLIEKLQQGLHNEPAKLRQQVQLNIQRIERETEAEAIVLGYGLCSRGTEKLRCQRCTLVVPRAHDCITLLLGDKQRYADYVAKHPGTYWYSPGWNKYHLPPGPGRAEAMYREYCEKYGEDNARFLMDLYHLAMNGEDLPAVIDRYAGRTGHVQIADSPGRGAPGTGSLPLADLLGRLTRAGYTGLVGLEYKPGDRPSAEAFAWLPREAR